MRGVRSAASIIALAAWATSATAAPYHLPGRGEDFRPPPPASLPAGYDPYRPPVPDRMPDVYADGRPYWFPTPMPAHRGSKRPPDMSYSHCGRWSSALAILAAPARRNGNSLAIPLPLRTQLNSRLTYKSLTAHAGEVFGRAEHGTGLFLKGFAGGGVIPGGTLQDEQYGQ